MMCKFLTWLMGLHEEKPSNIAPLASEIGLSIVEERWRWEVDNYHLTRDDGLSLWIANGSSCINVEKPKIFKFDEKSKDFLWRAYRAWCDSMTLDELMSVKKGGEA